MPCVVSRTAVGAEVGVGCCCYACGRPVILLSFGSSAESARQETRLLITPDEPETRTEKSLVSLGMVDVNVINLCKASAAEQDSLHFKFDNNNFYSYILNTYTPSAIAYRRESRIPILILSSPF